MFVEYEDWSSRRLKNLSARKKMKSKQQEYTNEYDTYYEDNDYDR